MRASQWSMVKTEAMAANGMVSSKHPLASMAGVEMLEAGGNAVDAAVATAFAIGVVEPWMNGLGGGGFMLLHQAGAKKTTAIDYSMVSPSAAHPDLYDLEEGLYEGIFPWRKTRNNEHAYGYRSICVPGTVAGLTTALESYGTMDLASVMRPAINYAEEGFPVDWFTMVQIALDAELLSRFPGTAEIFFKNGFPRKPMEGPKQELLKQPALAATLRRVAAGGAHEFYRGETAGHIVKAMEENGGLISRADLAGYSPEIYEPPVEIGYRDSTVFCSPGVSGGPTLAQTLGLLGGFDLSALGRGSSAALHLIAEASRLAFADRLERMGDYTGKSNPVEALLDPAYLAVRRGLIRADRALDDVKAGSAVPSGSTTHLSVVDRDRNMVSLTQTLLSRFGSRVTIPGAGVLMNNGMFWFNPEPGGANQVVGGKRPLCNMAPALVLRDGKPLLTIGASGGRKIMGAVLQIIIDIIDYGMSIQAAISAPRIDLSAGKLIADSRLAAKTLEGLRDLGHDVTAVTDSIAPRFFSSPCGILVDHDAGLLRGGSDPYHPASSMGY